MMVNSYFLINSEVNFSLKSNANYNMKQTKGRKTSNTEDINFIEIFCRKYKYDFII